MIARSARLVLLLCVFGCGGQSMGSSAGPDAGTGGLFDSGGQASTGGSSTSTSDGGGANAAGGALIGTGGDGCGTAVVDAGFLARLHGPVTFARATGQTLPDALTGTFGICRGTRCASGHVSNTSLPGYPEMVGYNSEDKAVQLSIGPSAIDGQYALFVAWNDGSSGEVDQVTYQPPAGATTITVFEGTIDYHTTIQGCSRFLIGDVTLSQPVSLVANDAAGAAGAAP